MALFGRELLPCLYIAIGCWSRQSGVSILRILLAVHPGGYRKLEAYATKIAILTA